MYTEPVNHTSKFSSKKLSLHFTECGKTVGKADYEFLQRSEVLSYHPCLQSIYAI